MAREKGQLVIGVGGYAVCLDSATGTEMWRTKLKATSIVTVSVSGNRVFAGAGGELFCLDPGSGNLLWRNKLKGLGLGLVSFNSGDFPAAAAVIDKQRGTASKLND